MTLNSKEITLIVIQTIIAIVIAIIVFTSDKIKQINLTSPEVIYGVILLIAILLLSIIWSTNKKISELSEEQENKITNEDLDKRFKTLEDLNDIRLNIRELQREVLNKNGKKK